MLKKIILTLSALIVVLSSNLIYTVAPKLVTNDFILSYEISNQPNVNEFVNKIKGPAVRMGRKWGIHPSQIIVQAGFESGWGSSALAKNNYNFFGIIGDGGGWRKFSSFDECLEYFCKNFYTMRLASYEAIIKTGDVSEVARQLNVNYAPKSANPNYDSLYLNFYRNYNFAQYDKMAFPKGYKEYPDIEEVRSGKTDGFTYHKGSELKWPDGVKTDIEDDTIDAGADIKSTGTEPVKNSGNGGNAPVTNWKPSEDKIPNMPKDRDFKDTEKLDKLFMTKAELDTKELQGIKKWQQEVSASYDDVAITGVRRLLALCGLLLVLLPAIWLVAYTFDLWVWVGNSPAFNLVTFGKARVDYSACKESWWFSRTKKQAGIKYFAVGDLIVWSGVLSLVGIMLINGYIYVQLGNLHEFYGYLVGL